jgi:hypothetical protein
MAGRPVGSKNTNKVEVNVNKTKAKNVDNTTVNKENDNELKKENELLKNELQEIKKLLFNLTQNQPTVQPEYTIEKSEILVEDDDFEIKPNKYIKVMSLNFGKLVLTTEGRGQGKVFTFNKFGDVKNIVYADLANLIHHQQSFAEQGRFYVFDKNVVKNHGLVEYYNKFMTREKIEHILDENRDEIISLFTNTTDAQKESIVNILIKKIIDGEDVDVNKVDVISRIYGKNIYDVARDKIQESEMTNKE